MKIILAKVYPEEGELLCDMYYRLKERFEYLANANQDISIELDKDEKEGCILVKSLKLGEQVN